MKGVVDMVSLTKNNLLECLLSVSSTFEEMNDYHDKIIASSIEHNMSSNAISSNNYMYDLFVYGNMINLRILSYIEDSFLDLMNDSDLNFGDIKTRMFINPNDARSFSNKQILKFIRNAVSHSDGDKELFKLSPNGKFIEVDLKNTKPIPFHIRITSKDLQDLTLMILEQMKCRYATYMDITNSKIVRLYISKVSFDIRNQYIYDEEAKKNNGPLDYDLRYKVLRKYLDDNNIDYEVKEYPLNKEQLSIINSYRSVLNNNLKNKSDREVIEYYFSKNIISSMIPLAQEKIMYLISHLNVVSAIYTNPSYTLSDFFEHSITYLQSVGLFRTFSCPLDKAFYDMHDTFGTIHAFYNNNLFDEVIMQMATYYFSSCSTDEFVTIGKKTINKENLRDALIHGRWFKDNCGNVVCFDALNGKNNDYNFYWSEVISIKELHDYCMNALIKGQSRTFIK